MGSQTWTDEQTKINVVPKNIHTLFFLAVGDETVKLLVQQQNLTYWHFLFTYRTEFRGASAYRSEKECKCVTGSSTYSDDDSAVDGDLPNFFSPFQASLSTLQLPMPTFKDSGAEQVEAALPGDLKTIFLMFY